MFQGDIITEAFVEEGRKRERETEGRTKGKSPIMLALTSGLSAAVLCLSWGLAALTTHGVQPLGYVHWCLGLIQKASLTVADWGMTSLGKSPLLWEWVKSSEPIFPEAPMTSTLIQTPNTSHSHSYNKFQSINKHLVNITCERLTSSPWKR